MSDDITQKIGLDASGFESGFNQITNALNNWAKSVRSAERTINKLNTTLSSNKGAFAALRPALSDIAKEIDNLTESYVRSGSAVRSMGRDYRSVTDIAKNLRNSLRYRSVTDLAMIENIANTPSNLKLPNFGSVPTASNPKSFSVAGGISQLSNANQIAKIERANAAATAAANSAAFDAALQTSLNNARGVQEHKVHMKQVLLNQTSALLGAAAKDLATKPNVTALNASVPPEIRGMGDRVLDTRLQTMPIANAALSNMMANGLKLPNFGSVPTATDPKKFSLSEGVKSLQIAKQIADIEHNNTKAALDRRREDAKFWASMGFGAGGGRGTPFLPGGFPGMPGRGGAANFALGAGAGLAFRALDAGIGTLANAFHEGADDAVEFNKQIALIRTISRDSKDTTESWSNSIRALSTEFGKNSIDVAAGAYQALSNQVIKGTKDLDFMRTALTLAGATNATTAQSVDALSSIINSYGTEAESATVISDKLFRAVDLGNFKLADIANSMGRVTSIARPLGISFSEVLASLETTTIKGVKADEALSALSNLYSELLKPSDALAASLQRLGFQTSQQGIATLGYMNFLRAVIADHKKFGGTIGELFPNIRGLREALLESADGFKKYSENLEGTEKSSDAAARGFKIVQEAAGKKTLDALNEIKNAASEIWTEFLRKSDSAVEIINWLRSLAPGETDDQLKKMRDETTAQDRALAQQAVIRDFGDAGRGDPEAIKSLQQMLSGAVGRGESDLFGIPITKMPEAAVKSEFKKFAQDRLKAIFGERAEQAKNYSKEISNIKATTAEYLGGIDKRIAASKEMQAKLRDSAEKSAFERAIGLAKNPREVAEITEMHKRKLEEARDTAFGRISGLQGKDFLNDKSMDDVRRAQQELVDLKDKAVEKKIEDFKAGKATRQEVLLAEEELTREKQKQIELEQQYQDLLNKRSADEKARREQERQFGEKFDRIKGAMDATKTGGILGQFFAAQVALSELSSDPKAVAKATSGKLEGFGGDPKTVQQKFVGMVHRLDYTADAITNHGYTASRSVENVAIKLYDLKVAADNFVEAAKFGATQNPNEGRPRWQINALGMAGFVPNPWAPWTGGSFTGFDLGGMVGATDTINAKLSKGEMVINERSTRNFKPILEAINNNAYRPERSGSNVSVGDINISVRGGNTSRDTISEIGRGLRREIRRGMLKFRGGKQ